MNEHRPTGLNALDCPDCGKYVEDSHTCDNSLSFLVVDKDGFICSPSVIPMMGQEARGMVSAWDDTYPFGAPHRVMRLVSDGDVADEVAKLRALVKAQDDYMAMQRNGFSRNPGPTIDRLAKARAAVERSGR